MSKSTQSVARGRYLQSTTSSSAREGDLRSTPSSSVNNIIVNYTSTDNNKSSLTLSNLILKFYCDYNCDCDYEYDYDYDYNYNYNYSYSYDYDYDYDCECDCDCEHDYDCDCDCDRYDRDNNHSASHSTILCGNDHSTSHLKSIFFLPTNLKTTSLSSYYDIEFKHDLQVNNDNDKEYNIDNGNSIYINNVNYDDEYCEAHNVVASIHNNESIKYQTYNDTVCDTDISDIGNIKNSCIEDNDRLYQLRDPVSSDINSNIDFISDAHQEAPPPISTIGTPIFLPGPLICPNSSSHILTTVGFV